MDAFTLRSVVRQADDIAGVIVDSWRLAAGSLERAKAEVEEGKWLDGRNEPNSLEIMDVRGAVVARRPYVKGHQGGWSDPRV